MPHADASYFPPGLSKAEIYTQVIEQTRGLIDGQRNWDDISRLHTLHAYLTVNNNSNFANVSSLLWHAYAVLPAPVNWAGFYVRDDKFPSPNTSTKTTQTPEDQKPKTLLLGPFHGKPACQLIHFGRGVCGTAAAKRETVLVDDVLAFPGHIACDAESRSEIVVPVLVDEETVGLIDVDCTEVGGFDAVDREFLEVLAGVLASGSDW